MIAIALKLGIIVAALVIWFFTQKWIGARCGAGRGIGDGLHMITERFHRHLSAHQRDANRVLVISSLFIDAMGLSLIAIAVLGSSFAPFIGMLVLFSLRQISQLCCTLPPPPGIIWRDPGFPTALVTYSVGNDFFFSGHTALAVLGAIELSRIGPWWLGAAAAVVAIGEAFTVLILRAHYTMDVITGALAAWLAADLAARVAPWVDGLLK